MKSAKSVKVVNIVMVAILVAATAFTAVYLFGGVFDAPEEAEAATAVKQGSTGQVVRNIQTKLKNWGYYKGRVDGVFGVQTKTAVKSFQKKNGLTADGIVGKKTADAMGITLSAGSGGGSGTSGDVYLLARLINGEARGEPYVGQVAVGAVVLNRVKSSKFPNTVSGVIYQAGAFDAVKDGQINLAPSSSALRAAQDALNGWDPTYGCLYYYNPKTATSKWMLSKSVHLRIGEHAFCL